MFGSWRRGSYETLGTTDSDVEQIKRSSSWSHGWAAPVLAAMQSSVIVFLTLYIILSRRNDGVCGAQLSPYSPFLENNVLQYTEFTEQNHLMQPSPYRGQPTPDVELAWRKLSHVPRIQFPESKLSALNKTNVDLYTRAAPQYGGGVLGYLNVFHELHCLNLIRQYTYRDSYDYSNVTAFRAPSEIVRGHIDHCIETLRKQLMCTSDVTPVIFIKDAKRPTGMKPDFNIKRKCRDYQQIQKWALNNRAEPEQ